MATYKMELVIRPGSPGGWISCYDNMTGTGEACHVRGVEGSSKEEVENEIYLKTSSSVAKALAKNDRRGSVSGGPDRRRRYFLVSVIVGYLGFIR